MSAKHTPGPWLAPVGGTLASIRVYAGDTIVAEIFGRSKDNAEANARLIAAAPELLEALDAITDQLERVGDDRPGKDGPFIEAARAALAKASTEAVQS